MKIIRLTRHEAQISQLVTLKSAFGTDDVEQVNETLPSNAREAVARFDEIMADVEVAEVVLPVNLLEAVLKFSEFSKRGGIIVRAITEREIDEAGSATFTFKRYEIVKKVEIVTEPVQFYLWYEGIPGFGISDCASVHDTFDGALKAARTGWQTAQIITTDADRKNIVWQSSQL